MRYVWFSIYNVIIYLFESKWVVSPASLNHSNWHCRSSSHAYLYHWTTLISFQPCLLESTCRIWLLWVQSSSKSKVQLCGGPGWKKNLLFFVHLHFPKPNGNLLLKLVSSRVKIGLQYFFTTPKYPHLLRVVDLALNQAAKPWFHQYLDPP